MIVPASGTQEWGNENEAYLDAGPESPIIKTAAKSTILIALLAAFCAMFFFGAVALVQSRKEPPTKTNQQIAEEKKKESAEKKEADEKVRAVADLLSMLFVLAVIAIWILAVYFTGAWLARDAYRRGMNGLHWCIFYFAFQFFNRLALVGIITFVRIVVVRAMNAGEIVVTKGGFLDAAMSASLWLVLLSTEAIHWGGLFVYLFCRRRGSMIKCRKCTQLRLQNLKSCPHCA
jgi:hypothetical protein